MMRNPTIHRGAPARLFSSQIPDLRRVRPRRRSLAPVRGMSPSDQKKSRQSQPIFREQPTPNFGVCPSERSAFEMIVESWISRVGGCANAKPVEATLWFHCCAKKDRMTDSEPLVSMRSILIAWVILVAVGLVVAVGGRMLETLFG